MTQSKGVTLYRRIYLIPADTPGDTIPDQCRQARRDRTILDVSRPEPVGTFSSMGKALRELLGCSCSSRNQSESTRICTLYYVPGSTRTWFARDEQPWEQAKGGNHKC